jgi:hypothetical protein
MLSLRDLQDSHPDRTFRLLSLPAVLCLLVTALFSVPCKLFAFFAHFLSVPMLCFQHFTDFLAQNSGGWGYPFLGCAALGACIFATPFRQAPSKPLCIGYSRYLLSHHQYVRLCQRNAPAPGVSANARLSPAPVPDKRRGRLVASRD